MPIDQHYSSSTEENLDPRAVQCTSIYGTSDATEPQSKAEQLTGGVESVQHVVGVNGPGGRGEHQRAPAAHIVDTLVAVGQRPAGA